MNDFVIHSIPGSPYGRAVLIALEEKGARYRLSPIAPGAIRHPDHLARHPFGRVPVLEDGDFRLYETQAILRYIDRILPQPALTPSSPRDAGLMDQLMNVNDWYLFNGVANVVAFQRIVGPRVMGLSPNEEAIRAAMPKAHIVFDELAHALGDKPFFAGDALTLADVLLAPQIDYMSQTPEWAPLTEKNTRLADWIDRMNSRPSMAATTWDKVASMASAA
jgi:glutathione S-transferase